jgi:uroporphyrinogen-III synthase/uroporphyrinogen III methyltransferase/synthase
MPYAVITREIDGGYAAALAALGLETVLMPVTMTAPPKDPDALVRALERGGYQAILCASARAARAVIRAAEHALPEIWVVGPATARVFEEAQRSPILRDGVKDGASLAHTIIRERDFKRVLVPRAEEGRDELVEILRGAGVIVDDIIAYRTIATPADDPALARGKQLLEAGAAAVCCVFAPSQAAALAALVGIRKSQTYVAIGDTTAAALFDAGAAQVSVAPTPTPEGIAKAVTAVYPREP